MSGVLVVGSGGREHSLVWKLAESPSVDEIHVAPGNPGIAELARCHAVDTKDPEAIADLAARLDVSLVVIGPEDPLVLGAADAVAARGIPVFGPSKAAAQLEGSKAWMKDVLAAWGVPTARHATFGADDRDAVLAYLETFTDGWVVKTDGLAAGKGVAVCDRIEDARAAVEAYLSGEAFGAAGTTLVIEECMTGPELSLFALCDGRDAVLFGTAQDHKRVGDGDTGPNTGGMGAYAPVELATDALVDEVMATCIRPTLAELDRRGAPYRGVLYCGLMLTPEGPKVVEYNIRFGDPECQVLVRRLESDLYAHLLECANGAITTPAVITDDAAVIVVMAAEGYPAAPRTGDPIAGLDAASGIDGVEVFHAGTRRADGTILTAGGRVLGVTARAATLDTALTQAYAAAAQISWPGVHYRHDIAAQGLHRS